MTSAPENPAGRGGLRTKGVEKRSSVGNPLVTVITVTLNGGKHLEQTIHSILDQSYGNIEYLVLDGGSTDGSLEIIREHQDRIDYWVSEPDRGIYDAMNKGITLARGELIALLNSDDYYEPETVQKVVAAYRTAPRDCILYGDTRILQEDLGLDYIMAAHTDHWKGMGFSHSAMFVSRGVYERLGCYDHRYRLAADYDFLLRALAAGIPMKPVAAVLSNYRNTGMSASNLAQVLGEMRLISRLHFSFFSAGHLKFLFLRYAKSMLLIGLQKLVGLGGKGPLRAAKRIYTKIFFAHR
jgi:glycosyltransferase involved in cell wall biosynthesis